MFSKPFSFEGRIRRTEYGVTFIIYFVIALIINLKSAMYKFGGLGKKYISPIGAEFALFFSPKRIFLREKQFFS